MNPIKAYLWQFIQMYKFEAVNEENNFNEDQKKELLKLMEIAEKNYESLRPGKVNKTNLAFHNFDKKFVEFGGDMDKLCDKVDEIYSEIDPKITKVADAAMATPKLLKKLRLKRPK